MSAPAHVSEGADHGEDQGALFGTVCNVWLSSPAAFDDHRIGRKHRRMRQQGNLRQEYVSQAVCPFPDDITVYRPHDLQSSDASNEFHVDVLAMSGRTVAKVFCDPQVPVSGVLAWWAAAKTTSGRLVVQGDPRPDTSISEVVEMGLPFTTVITNHDAEQGQP